MSRTPVTADPAAGNQRVVRDSGTKRDYREMRAMDERVDEL